jgi:hypothetical protein
MPRTNCRCRGNKFAMPGIGSYIKHKRNIYDKPAMYKEEQIAM